MTDENTASNQRSELAVTGSRFVEKSCDNVTNYEVNDAHKVYLHKAARLKMLK